MVLGMELPTEAVNTLSTTTWGAILVLTVSVMMGVIVYLARLVRTLNVQQMQLANARTEDAKQAADKSNEVLDRAVQALVQATSALDTLKSKVCEMRSEFKEELEKIRDKVGKCPHRGGG
jgi:uncharacterized protein HemX